MPEQKGARQERVTHDRRFALRSLLFVPGDADKKIDKAFDTPADVVILDLEDAVAPSAKRAARLLACGVLRGDRRKPVAIRINAVDTPWYLEDLGAIGGLRPDIVMLPKCEAAADIKRLCDQLSVLEAAASVPVGDIAILPLVTETAAALRDTDYRSVSERLCALGFAGEDLSADLGVEARDSLGMNPLLEQARRAVAMAAAAADVPAIDTPFPDPHATAALAREAGDAARLGFAGKMCIHPGQIDAVHAAFQPSEATLQWARGVVRALAQSAQNGVTLLDGKMIDRAHLRLAERYLRHEAPEKAQ